MPDANRAAVRCADRRWRLSGRRRRTRRAGRTRRSPGRRGSRRPAAGRRRSGRRPAAAPRPRDTADRSVCGRTQSRLRRVPPETKPSASASPGAGQVGDGGGVDHRGDPAGPGHLVEVAEQAEAGDVGARADARPRPRPGRRRGSAWSSTRPPPPRPRRWPSSGCSARRRPAAWSATAASPADRARRCVMIRSRSTSPVTAMPYLGSGSSIECPPPTWQPASCATSRPPRSTSAASSAGSTSRGQPSRFTATTGVPPIA